MENFEITFNVNTEEKPPELDVEQANILVSTPCEKDGKIYAFVSVSWNGKIAEYRIPECELVHNEGFSEEQLVSIKAYIEENVSSFKKEAAEINIFENMFGKLK